MTNPTEGLPLGVEREHQRGWSVHRGAIQQIVDHVDPRHLPWPAPPPVRFVVGTTPDPGLLWLTDRWHVSSLADVTWSEDGTSVTLTVPMRIIVTGDTVVMDSGTASLPNSTGTRGEPVTWRLLDVIREARPPRNDHAGGEAAGEGPA